MNDSHPGAALSRALPLGNSKVETQHYAEEVIAAAGALDEEGRAMLEEDLRSPCTEGIAVFRALALPRLRDPEYTRMLLVTLAQATPVHEASRSHRDRRRAGIEPYGWVVNASLAASSTTHPLLVERAHLELAHLRHVETEPCRSFLGRAVAGHASRRRGGPLALTNGAALQDASESDGARSVEGRWPGAGSA